MTATLTGVIIIALINLILIHQQAIDINAFYVVMILLFLFLMRNVENRRMKKYEEQ